MSDENVGAGSESGSDNAALAAAANFWSDSARESAAQAEVPDSTPSNAAALANEYADQRNSLEQEGELAPGEADGIPAEKKPATKLNTKQTATPAAKVEAAAEETGLDPVLRSIAEESGWKKDKIDALYTANPELAEQIFSDLADQYVNASRQYLQAPVNQTAAPQVTQPAQVQVQQTTQTASQLPAALSDEGLKKFADDNGQAAADLVKSLRDHFTGVLTNQQKSLDERVSAFEKAAKASETRAVANEAGTTIKGLREKFPTIYGKSDDARLLTVDQYQKTVELATLADQLRSGAIAQGRSLSVNDALMRAHYIVSRDSVKSETRQEIVKQIQRKQARATIPPTQRTNPKAAGQAKSDGAAVEAAAQKMAEIGMNEG